MDARAAMIRAKLEFKYSMVLGGKTTVTLSQVL